MKVRDTFAAFKKYFIFGRGNKAKSYKSIVASLTLLEFFTDIEELSDLTASVIENCLMEQSENRCWTPKTYRNHWQNLNSYFNWCLKNGLVKKNPMGLVVKPKLPKALPRAISKTDAQKVLHSAEWFPWCYKIERTRNVAILAIMLLAGLRLSEVINLRCEDVDIEAHQVNVLQGKGNKDRCVYIQSQLAEKLDNYSKSRKRHSDFFFSSVKSDKPLTAKNVAAICSKIKAASGVHFTPHMLRHTYGRLCVEANINLYTIKESMGHERISTTERYLSISNEVLKNSLENAQLI